MEPSAAQGREGGCGRVGALLLGSAAAVLVAAGTWSQQHAGLYGDGALFVELWRLGIWIQAHFLLLPAAIVLRSLLTPWLPLDRAQAIRAVSWSGSAAALGLVTAQAARSWGLLPAACASLLAAASPSFRFYAGAVEVHGLALLCTTVAAVLALRAWSTRRRARLALVGAAVLTASAHLTLVVMGLPLLLLHADAERRAARPLGLRAFVLSGALALGGVLAFAGAVLGLERAVAAEALLGYSAIDQYLAAMALWDATIRRPGAGDLLVLEALAPLGLLWATALPGLVLLCVRRPWLGSGLAIWIGLLVLLTWKVGAHERGAYLLPALPAFAWASAAALAELRLRTSPLALGGWIAAVLACAAGLRAWAGAHGLPDQGAIEIGGWEVARATVGLGSQGLADRASSLLGATSWWILGAVAAAACGVLLARGREANEPRSGPRRWGVTIALAGGVLVALASQFASGEAHRRLWPHAWRQPLVEICRDLTERVAPRDALVAYAPNVETKWTVQHFLDRTWIDLGEYEGLAAAPDADAPGSLRERWIENADASFRAARAAGGEAWLSSESLEFLVRIDAARRPRTVELVSTWLAEGRVRLLPPRAP